MLIEIIAFGLLSAVIIYAAFRVVTTPNITHAALFLAGVFVGVAGLFLLLDAMFLAAAQLLIYAGAVMAVVVFAIMLSDIQDISEAVSGRLRTTGGAQWLVDLQSPYWGWLPGIVAGSLLVLLLSVYWMVDWEAQPVPVTELPDQVREIGLELFSTYVVPFELASVLLLVAMLGAIILTRRVEDIE